MDVRRILRVIPILGLSLLLLAPASALASIPVPSTGQTVTVRTAPLTLDCVNMSPSARAYANQHHYCDGSGGGAVQPNGTVYGDCGSSSLFVSQGASSGTARFSEAVASTDGGIVHVNYTVYWTNYDRSVAGYVTGSYWNFSTTWTHQDIENTHPGFVVADMTGTVTLVWGGQCAIDYPQDADTIQ